VAYRPGATSVTTTATEVLNLRQGVCQDFVHLALGVLRAAGIPARYASGYLHPKRGAAVRETVDAESHAWCEAWVGEWESFDPTNGDDVGERHVLVARGRDYDDVAPLKGVYQGPPGNEINVRVTITRVA
jgi:transglutaminase-like putative cysteine protease